MHKRTRRWLIAIPLVLLALLLAAAGWASRLWHATPDYWHVVEATGEPVEREAEQFERWMVERMHRVRPDARPWQLQLDAEQINRWLATRLPPWAANQGLEPPEWLAHPMVAINGGRLIAAAEVDAPEFQHIVSIAYVPRVGEGGVVELAVDRVYIGRLPLPYDAAMDRAAANIEADDAEQRQRFEELRQALHTIDLTIDLDDGRRVDVIGLEAAGGRLTLRCRTYLP